MTDSHMRRLPYAVLTLALFAGTAIAALPKTWQTGEALTHTDLNAGFKSLDDRLLLLEAQQPPEVVFLKDTKPNGANGGQASGGVWTQRALNTLENPLGYTWVSLNANQVALAPGRYEVFATVPSHWVNRAQARLRNVTDGTTVVVSSSGILSERAGTDGQAVITANNVLMGHFSVVGTTKTYQVESVIQVASGDDVTLGAASSFGEKEIFTQVRLARVSK